MPYDIRPPRTDEIEAIQAFTVAAFEPIFASFLSIMGQRVFDVVYPDWRALQSGLVTTFFDDEKSDVWVAAVEGNPVGLLVLQVRKEENTGEIAFLVVDPAYQNKGVGSQLNQFALDTFKAADLAVAVVSTGGDPSHAAARHAYEKAGFKPLPSVWYFKAL